MKLSGKRCLLTIISGGLLFLGSLAVHAQVRVLSTKEKAQIVSAILRMENFFEDDDRVERRKTKDVYLLSKNLPTMSMPKIKNVAFVLLSETELEERKKTGIEFYSFGPFAFKRNVVEVEFERAYVSANNSYSSGNSTVFRCRKVAGKWRIRSSHGNVWVSERLS